MPGLDAPAARRAVLAEASGVVGVTLATITHSDLDAPIRLSTNPTERISVDPLRYGTRHLGDVYWFALAQIPLPEAGEGAADTVTLTIDIVAPQMARLTSLSMSPAQVDLVVVMSDEPDVVVAAYRGLETRSGPVSTDDDTISVEVGLMPRYDDPTQRHRKTAHRFPGLHRR